MAKSKAKSLWPASKKDFKNRGALGPTYWRHVKVYLLPLCIQRNIKSRTYNRKKAKKRLTQPLTLTRRLELEQDVCVETMGEANLLHLRRDLEKRQEDINIKVELVVSRLCGLEEELNIFHPRWFSLGQFSLCFLLSLTFWSCVLYIDTVPLGMGLIFPDVWREGCNV